MFKILAALLLFLIVSNTYAQNKANIKGALADSSSNAPIEYATIAVVNSKDTTLISYTLSDKKGGFNLSGIPVDRPTKLIISYVGYPTHRQHLQLKAGELKDFGLLLLSSTHLKEVIIQGERSPVLIKKDTIEFNTEAFKTRPNAVVEELLRKLPGVQVNSNGSILVNGKKISKLLIDGKEFFGNDPLVATRNLDADLLDKIQVYDDRENDPAHKLNASELSKVINLKLKSKIKKSTIGKIQAGAGSRDRYEVGGILSNFRDTLQVSLIGLSNNLNKTGFSQDDLYSMGGFDRSGGSEFYDGTFGGQSWGGNMEKVSSGGLNINNNYGEKLKSNLTYFYTNTRTTASSTNFNEQTLAETILSSSYSSERSNNKNKHALSGLMEWEPDTLNRFRYRPILNLGNEYQQSSGMSSSFNTLHPKLSESNSVNINKSDDRGFSHTASYFRRFKKEGESINIQHFLNLNRKSADNYSLMDLKSYVETIQSELLDRLEDNNNRSNDAAISIDYSYPLSKSLELELKAGVNYVNSTEKVSNYDKNPVDGLYNVFLAEQSSELTRNTWTQKLMPQLSYRFSKEYNIRVGMNATLQNLQNKFNKAIPDQYLKYFNLFPIVSFQGPGFSIYYKEQIEQPNIAQMQPITRTYTQLRKYIGNPELKPKYNREFTGNFYKYNNEKQVNFNTYAGLTLTDHNTIEKNTIDANGTTTTTPINKDGGVSGYMGANFGKQFKKSQDWQFGLESYFSLHATKSAFFLNQDEGIQYNYHANVSQSFNFNYQSLFTISTKYDFRQSITTYKKVDFKNINTPSHNIGAELTLRWPQRIIIDGKYNFNYNPNLSEGFSKSANILNLAVSIQMFKKDRGQLKLSVFDVLNQSISVYRYANENSVSTSEQQILRRYFLATYQYKIAIHKGK